jgi:hypothetical protein
MKSLATHRCIEIRHEIDSVQKKLVETSFDMQLFESEIITKNQRYPLTAVFDISYRKKEGDGAIGFLYLHTNRGVRTYYVREEPIAFIDTYQQLKAQRPELR